MYMYMYMYRISKYMHVGGTLVVHTNIAWDIFLPLRHSSSLNFKQCVSFLIAL